MFSRISFSSTLAMAVVFSSIVQAGVKDANQVTRDGKIVSISNDTLVMKNADGKEETHTFAADTKVTHDGNVSKASALKAGMPIRITTASDDRKVVTEVEAIDRNPLFANTHDGKIVRIDGNSLVMVNKAGQESTHKLALDVDVTSDGKACKPNALKAGTAIRVTTKKNDENVAIRVEAIEKNADFARN